jgi:hypothetical protein
MHLKVPPQIEAQLRKKAADAGVNAEQLALAALEHGLVAVTAPATDVMLPRAQWKATFDALLTSFPRRTSGVPVDCSRESMYGDRGR